MRDNSVPHKIAAALLLFLLILAVIYAALRLGFHVKWKSALAACREARMARVEQVEPKVFGGALGLAFDVTSWPVYAWANIHPFGTPFVTPCDH